MNKKVLSEAMKSSLANPFFGEAMLQSRRTKHPRKNY